MSQVLSGSVDFWISKYTSYRQLHSPVNLRTSPIRFIQLTSQTRLEIHRYKHNSRIVYTAQVLPQARMFSSKSVDDEDSDSVLALEGNHKL